jgi:replication factor C subunit 2/4
MAQPPEKKRKRKPVEDDDADAMDVDPTPAAASSQPVTVASIEEIAGVIPDETIDKILAAVTPKSKSTPPYGPIAKAIEDLVAEGWSATQIVTQLYEKVVLTDEVTGDLAKNKIMLIFSETDKRLVDGSDEHLTILDLCLQIAAVLGGDR